ncbi:IclR family transcriptional regulator [Neomicrococcus aestuarii]|nr:IclR family transcriptional regulator [Neomicrococcus aestuarii]
MSIPSSPIASVDRALLLILLMKESGPISVKSASEHLGVAPSTAHRLLNALMHRGFAAQDHERRYRLGPALVERHSERYTVQALRQSARSALMVLSQEVGETVQLMVLTEGNIQFIDGIESTKTLRVGMRVGDKMPAFVSAGGKAILALFSNAELEDLYRQGIPAWSTSRIDSLKTLKREMTKVRRAEFGSNFEEMEEGVVGLGVAVTDPDGHPVAAITTATPSIRFDRNNIPSHVAALQTAAAAISEELQELQQAQ